MDVVFLELKPVNDLSAELRYRVPGQVQYQSRSLPLAEIAGLYNFADRDFAKNNPDLAKIGQKLFNWLDGAERWLSRSIDQKLGVLVLAIDSPGKLGGLPWEILFYEGFLVVQSIVPIRVIGGFKETMQRQPSQHQLRALFMATDPIDVHPKLNFEAEEALILQETRELVMELRVEESGCVAELKSFWRRFKDYFDIFHLSGHADIRDGVPFFITESLEGERVDATLEDFADAFNFRYPSLMFLSGCRTGESSKQGGVASLAAGLVGQGAPAVLGWGRPVGDTGAIAAAMLLYRSVAEGFGLAEALALTYQGLIKEQVADWCLLRLYAQYGAWGELVLPPGDVVWQQLPEASKVFLDARNGLVPVAGKDNFVGRRRYLQRGLQALKSPDFLGIWLYGLGGVGKSSIACRLLDRLSPSYDRLVISGALDADKLISLLSRQYETVRGKDILANTNLSLAARLGQFLREGLTDPTRRLVFVLDDFEHNLEYRGTGEPLVPVAAAGAERKLWPVGGSESGLGEVSVDNPPVLQAAVAEVLTALLEGIVRSNLPHRVIVTSRYNVVLPAGFEQKVRRLQVKRMDRSDMAKLVDRLGAFQPDSGVAEDLRLQAQSIADGYPRLLEALDKVLRADATDAGAAMAGRQQEFLANILLEELLVRQEPELGEMLRRGTLFELPVPLVVLRSICSDLVGFDRHVAGARALGLLESGLNENLVRVPRVLGLELIGDRRQLAIIAVKALHQEWIEQSETSSEEQWLEIHRLAMLGEDGEIAVDMAQILSNRWIDLSLFSAAQGVCETTLALQQDGTLIYNLSRIYQTFGDMPKALDYCQQSIKIFREIGDRQGEAASLHQTSIIYYLLGDYPQALSLSQLSIEIKREIGDRHGDAASLHQTSIIYEGLGDYPQALSFSQQSIEICREIGDRQGEAAFLHVLSMIYQKLGDYPQALSFSQQSIEIRREIGDQQGEATSLHQTSIIYESLGDYPQALSLSQLSIKIYRAIGDRQGEAASLAQMAMIAYQQGDTILHRELRLQSAKIKGSIGDYGSLIITLWNLGANNEPDALGFLAQSLWLTVHCATNLKSAINLISAIYQKIPAGDGLSSLLGATALHFCQTRTHPELDQLTELSITQAANQQGITTQEDFDRWFTTNRLNDPEYFLPAMLQKLAEIIGDGWLFDAAAFLPEK
jgi:tetratricopeptide (TPR) repeat protein